MRNFLSQVGSVLTAVGISLLAISCGDKDEKSTDGKDGNENKAGKDAKGGKAGGSVDLAAQMVGYWAPRQEDMIAEIKKKIGDDPNAAAMLPMFTAMMASMTVEVTKDSVTVNTPGEPDVVTYKVAKTDAASKTLTLTVTDDGEEIEGTAIVEGDKLTLKKKEDTLILDRLTKA
jgi:hypothetical protein